MATLNSNACLNELLVDSKTSLTQDQLRNWTGTVGNTITLTYDDGTVGRIITKKEYKTGATIVLTKTYTYNSFDEVIEITAS